MICVFGLSGVCNFDVPGVYYVAYCYYVSMSPSPLLDQSPHLRAAIKREEEAAAEAAAGGGDDTDLLQNEAFLAARELGLSDWEIKRAMALEKRCEQ